MAYIECNFFSKVLGYDTSMIVLLPGPYEESKKYPVLYLLHGLSDDHTKWQRETSIERYAQENDIAVIMPTVLRGYYTDMYKGYDYFTFISQEVPQVVQSLFPITDDPEKTYVAGLSMGGYGAMKLALTYPERYKAAGSFSGSLGMKLIMDYMTKEENKEENKKQIAEFENVFGPFDKFEGSENDLVHLGSKLSESGKTCPRLYAWCGTSDFLYQVNKSFVRYANEFNLPLTFEEGEGDHSWKYWDECIKRFLTFIKE